MPVTCENLLPLSAVKINETYSFDDISSYTFLTFQDAFLYLVLAHDLRGKKLLAPTFYCDITLGAMQKMGLEVILCRNDPKSFDVDIDDFERKLKDHEPDIVIIYNYFGKTSRLYRDRRWLKLVKPAAVLVSDFAHTLIPSQPIEFLSERHFYIDSTRKPVSCMMAHLLAPKSHLFRKDIVNTRAFFRIGFLAVYLLRNACFRLGTRIGSNTLVKMGMYLFVLHDKFVWPPNTCFGGFWWDELLYKHIDFERIYRHRAALFREYESRFSTIQDKGYIELFDIPDEERKNICFYFLRVKDVAVIDSLLNFLQERGYWSDRLWEFDLDAFYRLPESELAWAKSIVVFPFTLSTRPAHIAKMASAVEEFFENPSSGAVSQA